MNTGEMIQQYIKLRDFTEAREKAFEEELKPYRDGMKALEAACAADLTSAGGDSIKTEHGTVYRSTLMSTKVADRDTFMRFVFDNRRDDFLTAAVAKDAVKEWIEQNNTLPPGIDVTYIHKTNFRRPT